jgi:hypothetical protein
VGLLLLWPAGCADGEKPKIRKSGFETPDEAWEAMLEARAALAAETYVKPSRQTVVAFFESWFPYIRTTTEATTAANYETSRGCMCCPSWGNVPCRTSRRP